MADKTPGRRPDDDSLDWDTSRFGRMADYADPEGAELIPVDDDGEEGE